ncbi:MAG: hypothetical protein HOC74_40705 [Gemmatimonadetes bacterium]|jgi:hypothetical protein|nr:hypothetical protein [Gemmatimonadota bacterium]
MKQKPTPEETASDDADRPYCSSRPEDGNPLRLWYVDDLIDLSRDLPMVQVNIHDLDVLDRVAWYGDNSHHGRLTVRQVANHMKKIEEADLSYPIILSADGKLLDGFHRVAKAYYLGIDTLPAKRFTSDPAPFNQRDMRYWLYDTYFGEK